TRDSSLKEKLIRYNLEDCLALETVTKHLHGLASEPSRFSLTPAEAGVVLAEEVQNPSEYKAWGKRQFATEAFQKLADCAYFDYQRSKIRLRSTGTLRRLQKRAQKKELTEHKANRAIEYKARVCPHCNGTDIVRDMNTCHKKLLFDLRITQR